MISRCAAMLYPVDLTIDVVVEPSTRFELVTPSLPRTCSTPELRGRFESKNQKAEIRGNVAPDLISAFCLLLSAFWSGRRGSNPRPTAWKAVTLPTELLPLKLLGLSC